METIPFWDVLLPLQQDLLLLGLSGRVVSITQGHFSTIKGIKLFDHLKSALQTFSWSLFSQVYTTALNEEEMHKKD